jgi:hypothetical protein
MPRRAPLDAAGTLHDVIVRGIETRRIVDDGRDRVLFCRLAWGAVAAASIGGLCMGPDAHILLRSGPGCL